MTAETPAILNASIGRRTFEFSKFVRTAGYVAVVIALLMVCGTFFVLMGLTPVAPTQGVVATVLIVNGLLVAFLIFVIGWEIGTLVSARRRGRAAARLHIRIVALFSVVAATPAILVAVVASITLDRGLDNWFSTRTRAIVETSATIANAYMDSQAAAFDRDIRHRRLARARPLLLSDPDRFQTYPAVAPPQLPGVFRQGRRLDRRPGRRGSQGFPPPPPAIMRRPAGRPSSRARPT